MSSSDSSIKRIHVESEESQCDEYECKKGCDDCIGENESVDEKSRIVNVDVTPFGFRNEKASRRQTEAAAKARRHVDR